MTDNASVETVAEEIKTDGSMAKLWLKAIEAAGEEEKDWRKDADESIAVYRSDEGAKDTDFNIHHSNVETIAPAIYNSLPIPDIRIRFPDQPAEPAPQAPQMPMGGQEGMAPPQPAPPQEPPAKRVSIALERMLTVGMDAYDFDGEIKTAIADALGPGRGVVRVRYTPLTGLDGMVAYEEVTCEYVPWKRFRRGPGIIWRDIPWVAFEHFLTREELRELSPKYGDKVKLDAAVGGQDESDKAKPDESDIFKRGHVWEIWDKQSKSVYFVAPSVPDDVIRAVRDPLGLKDFFPIPRPLYAIQSAHSLTPITPYRIYQALAEELNELTGRITALTRMIRVRGVYAGAAAELGQLADAEDGELIAASSADAFTAGGLDKLFAWWPIEPQVKALAQLIQQRDMVKQTIYEVTGISDIVRGASNAGETATAQQIKNQWGSLRVQRLQGEVQRFIRDLFRMKAEIIAEKFDPMTVSRMTKVELDEECVAIMRDDKLRSFSIDVETDSTIRADLTRNQEAMTQFVQATAGYIGAVAPAVQGGMMPGDAAVSIYAAFARNFKLGREVDAALANLADIAKTPQPPPPDPKVEAEKAKLAMEGERLKMDQQAASAKADADRQAAEQKLAFEREKHAAEMEMKAMEMDLRREEIGIQREADAAKAEADRDDRDFKRGVEIDRMDMDRAKQAHDMDAKKEELELKKRGKGAETSVKIGATGDDIGESLGYALGDTLGKSLEGALAGLGEAVTASAERTAQQIEAGQQALMKALAAPKRVVRDKQGRPVGVETVN